MSEPEEFPGGATSHVAGHARVRHLGHFPPPEANGPVDGTESGGTGDDTPVAVSRVRTQPEAIATVLLMVAGVVLCGIGIGVLFGWPWALVTIGVPSFAVGLMNALQT